MREVKYASIRPSNDSIATLSASPQCTPSRVANPPGEGAARPQVRGAERSGAELRAAGVGVRVWTCLYTLCTGGLHGWRVGGSPPWVGTGRMKFAPSAEPWACEELAREGLPRLNYIGFAVQQKGLQQVGKREPAEPSCQPLRG